MKQGIPFEVVNWEDPEIASVRVMLQYMTDRMYDKIRGKGWTYGVSMSVSVTEGRMTVNFIRSSHINNAYTEFRAIILNYTNIGKPESVSIFLPHSVKLCYVILIYYSFSSAHSAQAHCQCCYY